MAATFLTVSAPLPGKLAAGKINRPRRAAGVRPNVDPTKKILLIRLKSIGDIIFTLPAVHCLREALPDSRLSFLTSAENASVLEGFADIDAVLTLERSAYRRLAFKTICREGLGLLRKLRAERFSLVIDFQ